jgi:hypothetical protein
MTKLQKEEHIQKRQKSKLVLDSMANYYQTQIELLKEQLDAEKEQQRLIEWSY